MTRTKPKIKPTTLWKVYTIILGKLKDTTFWEVYIIRKLNKIFKSFGKNGSSNFKKIVRGPQQWLLHMLDFNHLTFPTLKIVEHNTKHL